MSRLRNLLVSTIAVGLIGLATASGTYAAFLSSSANPGNRFTAGTVYVTDDDAGAALFTISGSRPSDPAVDRCITVTYGGTLNAQAKLYGASSGALAPFVNLTVTEGTTTSPFSSCAGFTPVTVMYSGTLSAFPATFATGLADPDATWTPAETHAYRFSITLQNNPAAQGLSASAAFTWEARNL